MTNSFQNICIKKDNVLEFDFLVPPKSLCNAFKNQERNSRGSLCSESLNFLSLALTISCSNSCGLTWPLNALGFQIFLTRVLNLWTVCKM